MSIKVKVKLFFFTCLVIFFTIIAFWIKKNYFINKIIPEQEINIISEEECRKKIFQKMQNINNIDDFYKNNKSVYKIILSIDNIIQNLGIIEDQSSEFYELFNNLSKVNSFVEIKDKYQNIYNYSYKLPLSEKIIIEIEKNILYKKVNFSKFFTLNLFKKDNQKFLKTINFLKEKNFLEAFNVTKEICNFEEEINKNENIEENLDKKDNKADSKEDNKKIQKQKDIIFNNFEDICFDIKTLYLIQKMKNDIFEILEKLTKDNDLLNR